MTDIAAHIRIFNADPTDDLVDKRDKAIKDLAGRFFKDTGIDALLGLADGLAQASIKGGRLPDTLAGTIESAIQAQSTAFVRDDRDLEMLVIGLLALNQAITSAKPSSQILSIAELLACGSWLGLSAQPARQEQRLETLRAAVIGNAMDLCRRTASTSRTRAVVADLKYDKLSGDEVEVDVGLKSTIDAPFKALRANAVLDREEIDFLWWALQDWSDTLEDAYSSCPPPLAATAAGIDAARRLQRLPGDAHKHVVFRHVRDHAPLSLKAVVEAIGEQGEKLISATDVARIRQFPKVFVLLNAIQGSGPADGKIKRPLRDWAGRALLEAGLLRTISRLSGDKA